MKFEEMLKIMNHLQNANQNHNAASSHTHQNGYHQKEHFYTAGENVNWYNPCGKQCASFLKA